MLRVGVMTLLFLPGLSWSDENKPVARPSEGQGEATPEPPPADEKSATTEPGALDDVASVVLTKPKSSWDNLADIFFGAAMATPFSEGSVFVMSGELSNKNPYPLAYVVLRYELLDDKGNVMLDAEGYNRGAEAMRKDELGKSYPEDVKPIAAGGVDAYRMVFFHDEVPRFTSQRVRVVQVHKAKP